MKFKFIFILFSITLLFLLAVSVVLPLIMGGLTFSMVFWRINWPFILVWVFLFIGFNVFYFFNKKLFFLLEREDWPALVRYLEDKVIQKGRYSARLVKLLANSYLVLSDSAAVMILENKTTIAKPSLIDANALIFGTARILGKDISGAARFFGARKDTVKAGLKDWVSWYYGFSLLLNRRFEEAADEFSYLARVSKDAVVTALSSFFLSKTLSEILVEREKGLSLISSEGRERAKKVLPQVENWKREISRLSTEIHAAAILTYLEETGRWLYA